jgi:hypothetical protein
MARNPSHAHIWGEGEGVNVREGVDGEKTLTCLHLMRG